MMHGDDGWMDGDDDDGDGDGDGDGDAMLWEPPDRPIKP